jgi:two-component sensor histidine kinase
LLHEIQHRVKNTLGTVQAIASQTFRRAPVEEKSAFGARIQALAGAHDLLIRENWKCAALSEVVAHALAPFQDRGKQRIHTDGPDCELAANGALLLAMALHELGTNAVKYGALSTDAGSVFVTWQIVEKEDGKSSVVFLWREQDGPAVTAPTRKGFGSTLLGRALDAGDGHAEVDFSPSGVRCRMSFPISDRAIQIP